MKEKRERKRKPIGRCKGREEKREKELINRNN